MSHFPKWEGYTFHFNPRSLTGATHKIPLCSCLPLRFQSTLPHGSDTQKFATLPTLSDISIHAPSRERHLSRRQPKHWPQDFNPRSLTGATGLQSPHGYICRCISIHAPSRERQLDSDVLLNAATSFQSTLPHGSDILGGNNHAININFNPRSLTGATEPKSLIITTIMISIHAPSRERQRWYSILNIGYLLFQSTLPHGSDNDNDSYMVAIDKFQSTLPHGSDIPLACGTCYCLYISIHAPSRERQGGTFPPCLLIGDFNPRSLTGAT